MCIQKRKPITRRDFLAAGLTSSFTYMMAPTALDMVLNAAIAQAQAAGCVAVGGPSTMPAIITIDAAGGACFAWDIPPLMSDYVTPITVGGVTKYGKLGLGDNPTFQPTQFANAIQRSTPGTLIPQIETTLAGNAAAVLNRTVCVPVWTISNDDSSTVPNNIHNAAIAAGLTGKIKLLGNESSSTGIRNIDAFSLTANTPFVPNSVFDIVNSLGAPASGALGSLSAARKDKLMGIVKNLNETEAQRLIAASKGDVARDLLGCAHSANTTIMQSAPTGDPRTSPIATVFGLTAASQATATATVRAGMVLAALEGNSGPVGMALGGYDYHNQGQNTQNTRHQDLGTLIGQILASAQIMNKDVFIYLLTDGATDTADSATPGAPRGDSGDNGGNIMFMYKATGTVPTTTRKQVGYFNTNQSVARGSPTESIQKAAASVFLNYLAFAGGASKVATFGSLVPSMSSMTTTERDLLLALQLT